MKKIMIPLVFMLFWTGVNLLGEGTAISGRDVMLKVDNRNDGDDRTMEMKMLLENKRGKTRERSMVFYSKDYGKDSKSIFYFKAPSDVRGTAFLTWGYDDSSKDDDRWLYLPALKKVRRISGSSKNDSFMGSDMTYDDMGNRGVDEDNHTLLSEETFDGEECWVVESVSKDTDYNYSKVVSRVSKKMLVTIKVDFYDRQGKLLKTMTRSDFQQISGIWTSMKTVVENVQEKHKTVLTMSNIKYDTALKDSFFKVATIERGKF